MNGSMVRKPHLILKAIWIHCNTENFVPLVVPGLSSSSSGSSSTSMTPSRQERVSVPHSSSSSSSPTVTSSGSETREREDQTESDTSPVPVSTKVDDRSGQPIVNQANKIPKTNEKESQIDRGNFVCSEIPEWLQEFRDDEIPVHGDSHASSSLEVSLEPIFKRREDLGKHSVYTAFLEDRKLRNLSEDQNYKSTVQKTQWRSRTSCGKFW